jgi:hypothetical protein
MFKVVLTGVSEETLKNNLSLIAWGLARQGGPNAAHLARLAMLRTSPGLFLEKLLQPQCIGARNAKVRTPSILCYYDLSSPVVDSLYINISNASMRANFTANATVNIHIN